jgi:acyl carrier protein
MGFVLVSSFGDRKDETMREDIGKTLKQLLISDLFVEIPEENIGVDDGLQSVLGLDSVGFVELRVLCEQHFYIKIDDTHFTPENFSSIRNLAHLIENLQEKRK